MRPQARSLPSTHSGPAQTLVRITLVSSLTRALIGKSSPRAACLPPGSRAPIPGAEPPESNTMTTHLFSFTAAEREKTWHGLYLKELTGWLGGPYRYQPIASQASGHMPVKRPNDWLCPRSPPEYRVVTCQPWRWDSRKD